MDFGEPSSLLAGLVEAWEKHHAETVPRQSPSPKHPHVETLPFAGVLATVRATFQSYCGQVQESASCQMQSQNKDLHQQLQEACAELEQKQGRVMVVTSGSEHLRELKVQWQQEVRVAQAELERLLWITCSPSPEEEEEEVQNANISVQIEVPLTRVAPLSSIKDGQDALVQQEWLIKHVAIEQVQFLEVIHTHCAFLDTIIWSSLGIPLFEVDAGLEDLGKVPVKVSEHISSSSKIVKEFPGVIFRSIPKPLDQVANLTPIHTGVEDLLHLVVVLSINFNQRGRVMGLTRKSIEVVAFEELDMEDEVNTLHARREGKSVGM
ncbi:hypothetical protein C0995_014381 [Termitomyces sp. Mi166|nr:hypothetical protein C0995_014381 [Termitomyces sp. Mi166\